MKIITPYESAIKLNYLIKENDKPHCCITKKEILKIIGQDKLDSDYFFQVKITLRTFNIGIFQPQNRSEYLLINFNKIPSGKKLSSRGLENVEYKLMEDLVKNTKKQKIDIDTNEQIKNRISTLWAILIDIADQQKTISYKKIVIDSNGTFTHHRQIDTPLRITKKICIDYEYPPLYLLVFKESTGLPKGFHLDDNEKWKLHKEKIYESIKKLESKKIDWDDYL